MRYRYEIAGRAANEQTWTATGFVSCAMAGDFVHMPTLAMRDALEKMTGGRAVYGRPGVGCDGPYSITRLVIEEAPDHG